MTAAETHMINVVGNRMEHQMRHEVMEAVRAKATIGDTIDVTMRKNILDEIKKRLKRLGTYDIKWHATPAWEGKDHKGDAHNIPKLRRPKLKDLMGPKASAMVIDQTAATAMAVIDPWIGGSTKMNPIIMGGIAAAAQQTVAVQLARYICRFDPSTGTTRWFDTQQGKFGDACL